MLPVPTLAQLATFTGRGADTYGPFAGSALTQATLLFGLRTKLTVLPADADLAQLAVYAILQMADRIYLEQPNAQIQASPYQSESIGSYSYSKGSPAAKAQVGGATGLYWWDLAMQLLENLGMSGIVSGSIAVSNHDIARDADGNLFVPSPADTTDSSYGMSF